HVAVGERVREPLQNNDAYAAAEDGALGSRVERPAMPIRRNNTALIVEVTGLQRHPDGDTARQRGVALVPEQALAGEVDGHERGGAGRLDIETRAAEIEFEGDACGQEILVVRNVGERGSPADMPAVGRQLR